MTMPPANTLGTPGTWKAWRAVRKTEAVNGPGSGKGESLANRGTEKNQKRGNPAGFPLADSNQELITCTRFLN